MMPHHADNPNRKRICRWHERDDARSVPALALDRRLFLALGLCGIGGCATPLFRGQTPEVESSAVEEKKMELVGDFARPVGLNPVKLESIALVTNLDNTGSDPPPSEQRQLLIAEMQSHEVRQADKILA